MHYLKISKVVDAMNDGTLDNVNQPDSAADIILSSKIKTESAAWVGKQLGVERGQGPVRRASEKTNGYFVNIANYPYHLDSRSLHVYY
jgi:hypothetical protein